MPCRWTRNAAFWWRIKNFVQGSTLHPGEEEEEVVVVVVAAQGLLVQFEVAHNVLRVQQEV